MHRTPFIRRAALVICVGIALDAAQTTAGPHNNVIDMRLPEMSWPMQ